MPCHVKTPKGPGNCVKNLFDDSHFEHIAYGRTYDITPDGQRFVMVKEMSPPFRRIAVIQNWFEELKRLAPPKKE